MFLVDVAESAGVSIQDIIILHTSVQTAAYMASDQVAIASYFRKISVVEHRQHARARQAMLNIVELLRSTDTLRDLEIFEELANYALSFEQSPLCDTNNNCRHCWGCNEWRRRTETLQGITEKAATRIALLETAATVKCNECGLLAPEEDIDEQVAHLQKSHPNSLLSNFDTTDLPRDEITDRAILDQTTRSKMGE